MSSKPTENDAKAAEKAVGYGQYTIEEGIERVAIALAEARTDERTKFAAFCDEHGEPRKVLGDFWLTDDGAIIGKGTAYAVWRSAYAESDAPWLVSACVLGSEFGGPGPAICVEDCEDERCEIKSVWSTREAAEQAREGQR